MLLYIAKNVNFSDRRIKQGSMEQCTRCLVTSNIVAMRLKNEQKAQHQLQIMAEG